MHDNQRAEARRSCLSFCQRRNSRCSRTCQTCRTYSVFVASFLPPAYDLVLPRLILIGVFATSLDSDDNTPFISQHRSQYCTTCRPYFATVASIRIHRFEAYYVSLARPVSNFPSEHSAAALVPLVKRLRYPHSAIYVWSPPRSSHS